MPVISRIVCAAQRQIPSRLPWGRASGLHGGGATLHRESETSRTRRLGRVCFHPYCDEGPWASEIEMGHAGLPVKGVMTFLFDFGDSWRFELRLERIEPPGKKNAPIKVIESTGKPPKQFPD